MTREDIIRMAREAGFAEWAGTDDVHFLAVIERFAEAVAAEEREACAKVCESIEDDYRKREGLCYAELKTDAQTGASDCAHRIRARGEK